MGLKQINDICDDNGKVYAFDPESIECVEDDWRHDEWYLGWSHAEECDTTGSWDWSTDSFTNS